MEACCCCYCFCCPVCKSVQELSIESCSNRHQLNRITSLQHFVTGFCRYSEATQPTSPSPSTPSTLLLGFSTFANSTTVLVLPSKRRPQKSIAPRAAAERRERERERLFCFSSYLSDSPPRRKDSWHLVRTEVACSCRQKQETRRRANPVRRLAECKGTRRSTNLRSFDGIRGNSMRVLEKCVRFLSVYGRTIPERTREKAGG